MLTVVWIIRLKSENWDLETAQVNGIGTRKITPKPHTMKTY